MGIWGDFQGLTEATGEGGGSKSAESEATSFMDGPLPISLKKSITVITHMNICFQNFGNLIWFCI